MELPAIVALLALFEYMFFALRVGTSREKFGVTAPATSGHPEWERMFRVQQNTLEQLIVFIPALWIFAEFVSPTVGAAAGAVFLIGRPMYYNAYVREPSRRTAGFVMGLVANLFLVIGGVIGVITSLI